MTRTILVIHGAMVVWALLPCTSLAAQPASPSRLSPQAALQSIKLREGFRAELVAAEPLVQDPISLDWGSDGRLWVVEMADYPSGLDGKGMPGGRIRLLEDTDGDGRYDMSTVFLDHLAYPSAVMAWRQGVLISAAPDIIYAEDTNGDRKSDRQQVLYRGFARGNPQHQVNGFCWGLDNWIHLANGDSGGSVKSMRTGDTVTLAGRDVRIHPDSGRVDLQTGWSQYGRQRDDWGNWFGTSNSQPIIHFALADDQLRRNPHVVAPPARVAVATSENTVIFPISHVISHWQGYRPPAAGQPHRFGSACSTVVYRDNLFGPEFRQNTFTCEPAHNLVQRRVLEDDGLTFTSRRAAGEERQEFLASTDAWFRPTTCRIGPDGALWIVDMYRLVIEHPDLIDDQLEEQLDLRAGQDQGRIYRVVPVECPPRTPVRLDRLDTRGLVAALASPNGWTRDRAQQMLIWRQDRSAAVALQSMLREHPWALARLHALCTLDGIESLTPDIVACGLADPHPAVRRHAARLFAKLDHVPAATATALGKCVDDEDPHVRLECAYALGQWDDDRAGRALGQMAIRDADDPLLLAGVMSSVNARNLDQVLAAVFTGNHQQPRGRLVRQLLGVASAMGDDTVLIRVMGILCQRDGQTFQNWQLSTLGEVLAALRRRNIRWADHVASASDPLQDALGNVSLVLDAARQIAVDPQADVPRRKLAIELLQYRNDVSDSLETLSRLLVPQTPIELQRTAVRTLGSLDIARVPRALVAGWQGHEPAVRREILDVLLTRPHWRDELLNGLERGLIKRSDLDLTRRHQLLSDGNSSRRERAERLLESASHDSNRSAVVAAHQSVLDMPGDPARGAVVFKTKCASCHRVGSIGQSVGPDLLAISTRSPAAMLTAILDPNRFVEAKYRTYSAVTSDGRQFVGMLTDEAGHSITLISSEGQRQSLLRSQIDTLTETGLSLMPEGFERDLSDADLADVIAYLDHAPSVLKPVTPAPDGSFRLSAEGARILGPNLTFQPEAGGLMRWNSQEDLAAWSLTLPVERRYAVFVDYSAPQGRTQVELNADRSSLQRRLQRTDRFSQALVGHLVLRRGEQRVTLSCNAPTVLRNVWLVPCHEPELRWCDDLPNNAARIEFPGEQGRFELTAAASEIHGDGILLERDRLAIWPGESFASWTLAVKQSGRWLVFVEYACGRNPGRSTLTVSSDDLLLKRRIIGTGSWEHDRQRLLGPITLEAGYRRLTLRCAGQSDDCLIDVHSILLVPAEP